MFNFKKKNKPTVADLRYKERIEKQLPSTQDTLAFDVMNDKGLMTIHKGLYSRAYELGDVNFEATGEEKQGNTIVAYAKALNTLDHRDNYQLLVVNEKVGSKVIENLLMKKTGDEDDVLRDEINQIMIDKFSTEQNKFQTKRYAIFSTNSKDEDIAERDLNTLAQSFQKRFIDGHVKLGMHAMNGAERVKAMNVLTNPGEDLPEKGSDSKNLVAPGYLKFSHSDFMINDKYARVLWIKDYPKILEDRLIRELLNLNREMAISIHAKPYDMPQISKKLRQIANQNNMDLRRQQKENFKQGIGEDLVAGATTEVKQTAENLQQDFQDNSQKLYSGMFTVMVTADTKEQLKEYSDEVKSTGQAYGVYFESAFNYQEEAFNTVLPLGNAPLAKTPMFTRDMTTLNVATQVPFRTVEIQSPHGEFYGQNQISKNLITINRKNKKELITPSGLITGSSGSGKSVATKYQIINTLLNHPNDRVVIVDPESEYLPLGKQMGAQILDIATGTGHHLNLLDMAERDKLNAEDQGIDLVKEKTNLLLSLFKGVLPLTPAQEGVIDQVTTDTYKKYDKPTLKEWQEVLESYKNKENENGAYGSLITELALSTRPYTVGGQDIFSHETNIDLTGRFLIFNTKNLDDNLKPFAMKVILDQIWKQVVASQGKQTTWLYFDEIQVNFQTETSAAWFSNLWARVRKYGAIPTGITQNIITLLDSRHGQKMVANTEFMLLLRQKDQDLEALKQVVNTDGDLLEQFAGPDAQPGTGVIKADKNMVPFENLIPTNTKLYGLLNTDVATDKETSHV